jgi:hypothetical protein
MPSIGQIRLWIARSRNTRSVSQPSAKEIALALAKSYGITYDGVVQGGEPVQLPSRDDMRSWIERNS